MLKSRTQVIYKGNRLLTLMTIRRQVLYSLCWFLSWSIEKQSRLNELYGIFEYWYACKWNHKESTMSRDIHKEVNERERERGRRRERERANIDHQFPCRRNFWNKMEGKNGLSNMCLAFKLRNTKSNAQKCQHHAPSHGNRIKWWHCPQNIGRKLFKLQVLFSSFKCFIHQALASREHVPVIALELSSLRKSMINTHVCGCVHTLYTCPVFR